MATVVSSVGDVVYEAANMTDSFVGRSAGAEEGDGSCYAFGEVGYIE